MIFLETVPQNYDSRQLNLQTITVWVTDETFYIQPNFKKSLIPTFLQINRKNKTLKEVQQLIKHPDSKPHFMSLFLGILTLDDIKIIVLAKQAFLVSTINSRDIFKIIKPIFLFYDPVQKDMLTEQQAAILLNITAILQQGLFFSFSYDLTVPINTTGSDEIRRNHFNWAQNLQKQLEGFNKNWSIPVIQGFVGKLEIHISGQKFSISLISRRSVFRSGTQDEGRGVDELGYVGNFVETQQIITIDQYIFSFIQCRGSVPLFWEVQDSYGGMFKEIKIKNTAQKNQEAFQKHINKLFTQKRFDEVCLINLLSQNKQEKILVQNYQYLVRKLKLENIRYAYFDLHANCPNKNYEKLNDFLTLKINTLIEKYKFTAMKAKSKQGIEVLSVQTGMFRVNCLNCIDRTSITQMRIAAISMIFSLRHLQLKDFFGFTSGLNFLNDTENPFVQLYRNLWADNADYLSKQYTGTGSTQSIAVRKGKLSYMTSLDHGIKSISRALRNINHSDQAKNRALSLFLGNNEYQAKQQQMKQLQKNQKNNKGT